MPEHDAYAAERPVVGAGDARHRIVGGVIGNRMFIGGGHITAAFSGGEPLNSPNLDALELR